MARETGAGRTVGRVLSIIALVFCFPLGVYFASIATEFVGIVLGVVGYGLGARRLAVLAVVLCTAAVFLGLIVGEPGRERLEWIGMA